MQTQILPQHIAIIMDGNGRWAKKRFMPRVLGHMRGVSALKNIIRHGDSLGLKALTVFAFGRENWNRPKDEVSFLMNLLYNRLGSELTELHQKNTRIRFLGDRTRINQKLQDIIKYSESMTESNTGLQLNVCLDYSGQYDIIQAVNQIITSKRETLITEEEFEKLLLTNQLESPDLLIRTSGESRISNFMLWQLAYSEMYFTDTLWPDFSPSELDKAIDWFNTRERRFGQTSEQLKRKS